MTISCETQEACRELASAMKELVVPAVEISVFAVTFLAFATVLYQNYTSQRAESSQKSE